MNTLSHKQLLEWASSMGFASSIPSESFQKLLTPEMKPCWKHIINHVKPTQKAQVIRRNILLSKLRPEVERNKILTVRAEKLSQIPSIRNYEQLMFKISTFSTETVAVMNDIRSLQLEFKKLGISIKKAEKSIAESRTQILILKKKREQYKQKLQFKCFLDSAKFFFPSSDQVEVNVEDKMKKLEEMLKTVCNSQSLGGATDSEKEMIHDYVRQYFKDVPPETLMKFIVNSLQSLTREVAVAAANANDAEEMESIRNETASNECKSLEESLQEYQKTLISLNEELISLRNSSMSKCIQLEEKKTHVMNKLLQIVGEEYEKEASSWLSAMIQDCIFTEKLQVIQEENRKILDEIESLEYSVCLFDRLSEAIQTSDYDVEAITKRIQENLLVLGKRQSMNKISKVIEKICSEIKNFQNKMSFQANDLKKDDPFINLVDIISNEVSQLIKTPLDALRCKESSDSFPQDALYELQEKLYTPFTPQHYILQDNIKKSCWAQQTQNSLEEMQPSPIVEYDLDKLSREIINGEDAANLSLENSVHELDQLMSKAETNIQQATENISFWIDQPFNKLVQEENFSTLSSV